MCQCAAESIDCMTRPGVSSLCCPVAKGCCDSQVSLDTIEPGIKTAFDLGGVADASAAGATAVELTVLESAATAIELAFARLAADCCMARYAADCCLTINLCVPDECKCSCDCRSCDVCVRESVCLASVAGCVDPSRISAATFDETEVSVNGSVPGAGVELTMFRGSWKLFGAVPGRHALRLQLKPALVSWTEAVLSLACKRVRCVHGSGCKLDELTKTVSNDGTTREQFTWVEAAKVGMIEDKFSTDLDSGCSASSGYVFGGVADPVESVRWGACPMVLPSP